MTLLFIYPSHYYSLLFCTMFFSEAHKKLFHPCQTRRKIKRQESMWKKEVIKWDKSLLHISIFPDAILNILFYETKEVEWAGSNILQNLLCVRHSFRFFSFSFYNNFVKMAPIVSFYRWPSLDSQKVRTFFSQTSTPCPLHRPYSSLPFQWWLSRG